MVYIILIALMMLLILVLWYDKRQIKSICRQLVFLREHDSNMLVSTDLRLGGLEELADTLNCFLREYRKEREGYRLKEEQIAQIYTSLSHDIRTPLTSLDGYFQLLEKSESVDEQDYYIAIIQERIASLRGMLEELFEFTKLENASYELELSACCINRVLKETVFSYYEEWKRKGIEVEFQLTEKLLYIEGNEQALRRIFQNIIKNGLDHGEKWIRIVLKEEETGVKLCISNRVKEPELIDVNRVFEQFYCAQQARSGSSTGLGLAIARGLVLRMQGQIEAQLVENEFCILLLFCKINSKI